MANVLIVANQTLCSDEVIAAVLVRNAAGPCAFHIVVPATPLNAQEQALRHSEHPGAVYGESGPVAVARMRLQQAIALLARANIPVTGDVGDPDPFKAISTAVRHNPVDEVLLGTLRRSASRWLAADLPRRVNRRLGLPVTLVETGKIQGHPKAQRHTPAPSTTPLPRH